jgi:hypothetical protein
MRTLHPAVLAAFLTIAALSTAAPRLHAQAADSLAATLDRGRFIVLDHGQPVATERFEYDRVADSLQVSAVIERRLRAKDGSIKPFRKSVSLIVDSFDYGLRRYMSRTEFDGHVTVKGVMPTDTLMTIYTEIDDAGTADRLVMPPGRLFVMDPLVFTLFDVVCHNLQGHILKTRPISIVTLGQTSATSEATVTVAGADTVTWAGKRTVTAHYTITDESSTFQVWASPKGELLRLVHEASGLVVMRDETDGVAPAPRATTKKPARKPAASAKKR